MNSEAVDNLARADVELRMGFTDAALAHAVLALGFLIMDPDERAEVQKLSDELAQHRTHKI